MSTRQAPASENEVTILARILGNEDGQLPHDLARYLLDLNLSERDKARMHDLAVRNLQPRRRSFSASPRPHPCFQF